VRRLICIFLLLCLPLQSFAMQSGWLSTGHAFNLAHELEHIEGVSHHHDADNTVHYDDSSDSTQHSLEYSATSHQAPALPSFAMPPGVVTMQSVGHQEIRNFIPDPIPDRPQRPPQSRG
jgi:hypothetical protein